MSQSDEPARAIWPRDDDGMADLWQVYGESFADVTRTIRSDEVVAPRIEQALPIEATRDEIQRYLRAVFVDDEWGDYEVFLESIGVRLARWDVPIEAWSRGFGATPDTLVPKLIAAFGGEPERLARVLRVLWRYLHRVEHVTLRAYARERARVARERRAHAAMPLLAMIAEHVEALRQVPPRHADELREPLTAIAKNIEALIDDCSAQLDRPPRDTSAPTRHTRLSRREREVLGLIGRGLAPAEIGAALSLSVKTVSTYRARLLDKLGMSSTAQLLRYAIASGLSAPPEAAPSRA